MIRSLIAMFNRYGVPDSIVTDDGALLCIISVRNICEVIELPTYNFESRAEQWKGGKCGSYRQASLC